MKFLFLIFFLLLSLPGFGQEGTSASEAFDAAQELKKIGYDSINAQALTDRRVILIIKRSLQNSYLAEAPPEVVKALIDEKFKDSYLGAFLKSSPRVYDLLVDILRDKEALVGLVNIALRREDLKSYLHFWIAFLIGAWLIKKALFSKSWGPYKTMAMGMLATFVVTSVSVTIFYNTFHKELAPTLKIISRHLNL